LILATCDHLKDSDDYFSGYFDVFSSTSDCGKCCSGLTNRPPQQFTYYQNTGRLVGGACDNPVDTHGYSGSSRGNGKDNPST